MSEEKVCPVEKAGALEAFWRKWLQNPKRILRKYLTEGKTALDFGCGPGFFTVEAARLVGSAGKVVAVDLQEGMLDIVRSKIEGSELAERIELLRCEADSVGYSGNADFIIAFYVVHETPDARDLLNQFYGILNPGGKVLIAEPNFHVTKELFAELIADAESVGFLIDSKPNMFFSRSVVLRKPKSS